VAGAVAERLGLDGEEHRAHLAILRKNRASAPEAFVEWFQKLWRDRAYAERTDPDRMLYDGFVGDVDRALCNEIINATPAQLAQHTFPFTDSRLQQLFFRYRARNYPHSLSTAERAEWREHCQMQWWEGTFTQKDFEQALTVERANPDVTAATHAALSRLEEWVGGLLVGE
jgi:exodeoxyribonuclease-1